MAKTTTIKIKCDECDAIRERVISIEKRMVRPRQKWDYELRLERLERRIEELEKAAEDRRFNFGKV